MIKAILNDNLAGYTVGKEYQIEVEIKDKYISVYANNIHLYESVEEFFSTWKVVQINGYWY